MLADGRHHLDGDGRPGIPMAPSMAPGMLRARPSGRMLPGGTSGNGPWWYLMFGLPVLSDVRLPFAPMPRPPALAPAWVIRLGDPALSLPRPDGLGAANGRADLPVQARSAPSMHQHDEDLGGVVVHRGDDGTWWWWDSVGTFHVTPDARQITLYPGPQTDERSTGLVLTGSIAAFVLYQLGHPVLHASAVATPRGAVAFLGPKGQGKSTIAAAFLRRGAALLADDMLLLRHDRGVVSAVPGPPAMRLWRESAEQALGLNADSLPNVVPFMDKKLVSLDRAFGPAPAPARESVPLSAVYILDRFQGADQVDSMDSAPKSRFLGGQESLTALLANVSHGAYLSPLEMLRFLPIFRCLAAQARVRVLSFRSGFALQESTYEHVMGELDL